MSTWSRNNPVTALALLTTGLLAASIALIFFYAPVDADGLNQKIFYFHVGIAFTAYACFAWGGWKALRVLWKGCYSNIAICRLRWGIRTSADSKSPDNGDLSVCDIQITNTRSPLP